MARAVRFGEKFRVLYRHLALISLATILWGLNLVAGKIGVGEMPPILFAALRMVVLAVILAPWFRLVPGQAMTVFWAALLAGATHFGFFFLGLSLARGVASVAIVVQLITPFSVLLAIFFLGERIGWRRALGIGVAFAGVVLVGFDPEVVDRLDAVFLVIIAALSMAASFLFVRRLVGVNALIIQAWVAMLGAPALLAASFVFETGQIDALTHATARGIGAVLFSALGASLVGHGTMVYLLQRYEVSLVSSFTLLAPVIGIAASVAFLGETISWRIVLGGVMTLGGVAAIHLRAHRLARAA